MASGFIVRSGSQDAVRPAVASVGVGEGDLPTFSLIWFPSAVPDPLPLDSLGGLNCARQWCARNRPVAAPATVTGVMSLFARSSP